MNCSQMFLTGYLQKEAEDAFRPTIQRILRTSEPLAPTIQNILRAEYGEKHPVARMYGETMGPLTSTALLAAAGGGLGYVGSGGKKEKSMQGAAIGTATGMTATVAALLLALITKRRTNAEQDRHNNSSSTLADFLVPGMASYNAAKRSGVNLFGSD